MSGIRWRVGCAGWSIPRDAAAAFPHEGSHLERYAARFSLVEINSSFHRPHQRKTYERWAASVPADLTFAAKVPRAVTHDRPLAAGPELERFLGEVAGLGAKLGALLVQLPPKLALDRRAARRFFAGLRARHAGPVVLEARHASWFAPGVDALLVDHAVAQVAADPRVVPQAGVPGGWRGLTYFRLHGSPVRYRSSYDAAALDVIAGQMCAAPGPAWCVFDNTASGAAVDNALALQARLREER